MFLKCGSAQTSYRPITFITSFDHSNKHSLCCLPATNLTKLSMTLLDGVLQPSELEFFVSRREIAKQVFKHLVLYYH